MKNIALFLILGLGILMTDCKRPEEDIIFKYVRGVTVEVIDNEPRLKANVVFFNPNDARAKLRKIKLDIYVEEKIAGHVDQKMALKIPPNAEFTVPVEVRLNLKEQGFLNTLFSILGAKRMDIRFVGSIRINYRGIPVNVPVDYKSEIRIKI